MESRLTPSRFANPAGRRNDGRMIKFSSLRTGSTVGMALGLCLVMMGVVWMPSSPTAPGIQAQAPTTTPTMIPVPPPAPLPDLNGTWSITRSWYRGCPDCGMPMTLSSTWVISQTGSAVLMKQGPRGELIQDGAGGVYLRLEGLEQSGPLTLRFHYAGLRVSANGLTIEGGFSGSERLENPCGDRPVVVTCFANAGYMRATRLGGATAIPPATLIPSPMPSNTPLPPPSATARSSSTSTATASATATATVTPSPTPRPPLLFFPRVGREG
jgi:hypothetical protein